MQIAKSIVSDIVNVLISGGIIDEHVHKDLYHKLQDDLVLEEINNYLDWMGKKCVRTKDNYGFYCVFSESRKNKATRELLRKQFSEIVSKMEPLNDWLRLCRSIKDNSRIMQCGDTVTYGELITEVERSPLIMSQLKELVIKLGKASTSPKEQISSVLQYLVSNQYLHPTGNTGTTYIATAKWSVFYDELEYICTFNGINYDEIPEPEQGELI